MALNLQTFKTRTLSAIIFAVIMLAGLLLNYWSFFLLFSVVHFGCWFEYHKLMERIHPAYKQISSFHRYIVPLIGFALMLFSAGETLAIGTFSLHSLGWWLLLLLVLMLPLGELLFAKQTSLKCYGISLLGLVYISMSWSMLVLLRDQFTVQFPGFETQDYGKWVVCILVFSIWINDTMAYIVGSLIGKTPFSPISPKKTWEGTIGGAVLAIVVITTVAYFIGLNYIECGIIAAISAVFGTLGDLLESKLKRMAGIKDSGNILPGHGGFLDRFDSLLIATPVVWLYFFLFQ